MENLMNFIESISPLFFYNVFLKNVIRNENRKIYSDWKKYIVFALISTSCFYVLTVKLGISTIIYLILLILTYTLVLCKFNKITFANNLILITISVIMVFISEIPPTIFALTVFKDMEISLTLFILLISSIVILNVLLFDKFLTRRGELLLKIIEKYSWISLIILNCFIYFLFIKILVIYDLFNPQIVVQVSAMSIVLILSNIVYIANLYKNRQKEKQKEVKTNINPLIDELLNKMKAREHEYKNHLNILYCMIQVCKNDELKDRAKTYIGNITEDNLLSKVTSIENTIVKAILFSKLQEAEKREINYTLDIASDLDSIPFDDSELTIILSNLINNAIEATTEIDNKKMSIYIGEEGKEHIIKVKNSTNGMTKEMLGEIFKEGFSTKGENRGYGLYNIKSIVDKYKGKIKLSLEENMLEFHITV